MNFGGPWSLGQVRPFLFELFRDPEILIGVPGPIRTLIAAAIALIKGGESKLNYARIGGFSPQLSWTEKQAMQLQELLGDDYRVEIGMRASSPKILEAVKKLFDAGVEEIVCLPLFPQYSFTTTKSAFNAVTAAFEFLRWYPKVEWVRSWYRDVEYIDWIAESIFTELKKDSASSGEKDSRLYLLFSAHSLPLKTVAAGDPYPTETKETVDLIVRSLELKLKAAGLQMPVWSLAFQSRNGKMPWLQPYLEDEIERLNREENVTRLLIAPVSFVSDHIETSFELDLLYAEQAKEIGYTEYRRTPVFNGSSTLTKILAKIVKAQVLEKTHDWNPR